MLTKTRIKIVYLLFWVISIISWLNLLWSVIKILHNYVTIKHEIGIVLSYISSISFITIFFICIIAFKLLSECRKRHDFKIVLGLILFFYTLLIILNFVLVKQFTWLIINYVILLIIVINTILMFIVKKIAKKYYLRIK
jgi:hypothetical protein